MPHLVEVAFKGNRKEFFLWNGEEPPSTRTSVVVESDRGEDLGRVHAIGDLAALRKRGCTHGLGEAEPTLKALRVATADDVRRLAELRAQDDGTRRDAMTFVKTHQLPMKISDAEWRWDRRKLTLYFTADRRIDFRALVRDLAAKFRTRIELKQIGVRDEAKRLDGVGRCGRQYCSASWLPDLRPVSLSLAKSQKLSLNPPQISGACGRLMCCLRYEHEWYVETRRRFPKEGKIVTTAKGEEKVVANDLFRERVTLRGGADGETRIITLEQLNKELRGEPVETDAATEVSTMEQLSDELLAMTDTVERPIPTMLRMPQPAERPVTIARAPQRDTQSDQRRNAPQAAKPVAPPARRPDAPAAKPDERADATQGNAPQGDGKRSRRRRRGRRGRGRGRPDGGNNPGGAPGNPPPDAAPPAPST